ncbi:cysteine desulfurylase family member [Holotrichia oblita]|nr:cysteine desulfurylase family member [Holotrichia oblita]
MNKNKRVFLDFASTTYVSGEVVSAMMPYFTTDFGNSASLHLFGRDAEKAVAAARAQIAKAINADPSEIYFTSGATESNNWLLKGVMSATKVKRALVSRIEHPSVMDTCKRLAEDGYKIEFIDVDKDGIISVSDMISKLAKPAALVSVMAANNEVGTIQFLNTVANLAKERGAVFHTDATQAIGSVFIDVKEMKIDALSLSAHKIYGPKGIGALYIRKGLKVDKFMHGGHQERGLRGGTTNVPAVESKNAGMITDASGVGKVGNVKCGDIMKIYIKIDKNGVISDAKFKTFGCVSAIASTSVACDMIIGKTIEDALKVTNKDVIDALGGVPAQKIHCSVLAQEAIESAINDYKKKQQKKEKA